MVREAPQLVLMRDLHALGELLRKPNSGKVVLAYSYTRLNRYQQMGTPLIDGCLQRCSDRSQSAEAAAAAAVAAAAPCAQTNHRETPKQEKRNIKNLTNAGPPATMARSTTTRRAADPSAPPVAFPRLRNRRRGTVVVEGMVVPRPCSALPFAVEIADRRIGC